MSWANTPDRASRTAAARKASHVTRFIDAAKAKHPTASEEQISAIADSLRKAHYTELARRSAAARRVKREMTEAEKRTRAARVIAEYNASSAEDPPAAAA